MSDQATSKETHCPHQCPHSFGDHVKVFSVDDSRTHVFDATFLKELGRKAAELRLRKVLDLLLNQSLGNA